jgi:hypothetical protein
MGFWLHSSLSVHNKNLNIMKKNVLLLFALFLLAISSFAQTDDKTDNGIQTLFGEKPRSHGGYIGLGVGYTQLDSKDAFTTTFRGAWIINHSFAMGISATGFSNDLYVNHPSGSDYRSLQGGFGGVMLQPYVAPRFPIHISFPVTLGAGGVAALSSHYYDAFDANWYVEDEGYFLLVEPSVDIELNLVKFIRASFGISYRYTTPLAVDGYSSDAIRGFAGNFTLSFGKF